MCSQNFISENTTTKSKQQSLKKNICNTLDKRQQMKHYLNINFPSTFADIFFLIFNLTRVDLKKLWLSYLIKQKIIQSLLA